MNKLFRLKLNIITFFNRKKYIKANEFTYRARDQAYLYYLRELDCLEIKKRKDREYLLNMYKINPSLYNNGKRFKQKLFIIILKGKINTLINRFNFILLKRYPKNVDGTYVEDQTFLKRYNIVRKGLINE